VSAAERSEPVSRDDIEAKLRQIQGSAETTGESVKGIAVAAGATVVVGVVVLAYFLGRRKGRRRSTVVEIRRV
jgi:hypothetical protein